MGEKTPEFNEKNKKLMNHSPLIQSAAGNTGLFQRAIHTAIILLQKSGQNKPGFQSVDKAALVIMLRSLCCNA